jgi:DNA-directed RNA polymerase specialized sigma24 family protein
MEPTLDEYVERLITATVATLIRYRSIPACDRDDWLQDLRLAVLSSIPQYKSDRSQWHTYASGVVHRSVQMKIRARHAACRSPDMCESLTGIRAKDLPSVEDHCAGESDIKADFEQVMARLTRDEKQLARFLHRFPIMDATRRLGWSWRKFSQVRDRLRHKLGPFATKSIRGTIPES